MFEELKKNYKNGKEFFLYFYSGEFMEKSLLEFKKSKKVSHTRRVLALKKANELFQYFKTQSFKTQSFKDFNQEQNFISFFQTDKMKKLVDAATSLDPLSYGMGVKKVGIIDVEAEKVVDSWKRTGKQYGVMAEHAYVPPMVSVDKMNRFSELEVEQKKFYIENLGDVEVWQDDVDPKIYEKFVKGKQES